MIFDQRNPSKFENVIKDLIFNNTDYLVAIHSCPFVISKFPSKK